MCTHTQLYNENVPFFKKNISRETNMLRANTTIRKRSISDAFENAHWPTVQHCQSTEFKFLLVTVRTIACLFFSMQAVDSKQNNNRDQNISNMAGKIYKHAKSRERPPSVTTDCLQMQKCWYKNQSPPRNKVHHDLITTASIGRYLPVHISAITLCCPPRNTSQQKHTQAGRPTNIDRCGHCSLAVQRAQPHAVEVACCGGSTTNRNRRANHSSPLLRSKHTSD